MSRNSEDLDSKLSIGHANIKLGIDDGKVVAALCIRVWALPK